jgi:hypothetical protein
LWVKKATGLGVTEFFLRFMAWLCLRNNDYRNSQMCIVTGPNQELAIKLIKNEGLIRRKTRYNICQQGNCIGVKWLCYRSLSLPTLLFVK